MDFKMNSGGTRMQKYNYLAELVDPRPHDGSRFFYRDMPLLPVSFECDWMVSNEALLFAVTREILKL
jgi:hypothetical protein